MRNMIEAAAPMLDVQFGQASDFGKVRTNNEDAMGSFIPASRHQARSHGFLFAVADGVGGYDLGEVASATAVKVLTGEFAKAQAGTMLISLLPRLIQHANAAVHDCTLAQEYRGKRMATTLVACALRYDQAIVSHVGDSRCYLIPIRVMCSFALWGRRCSSLRTPQRLPYWLGTCSSYVPTASTTR